MSTSEVHEVAAGRELRLSDDDPAFPARLKLGPHRLGGFQAQVSMTVDEQLMGAGIYLTREQLRDMRNHIDELLEET